MSGPATNESRRPGGARPLYAALALFAAVAAAASLGPAPVAAQGAGDLVVAPTRVVFEGRARAAQLSLVNKGAESATYRITAINMRMDETGNMTEIAEPDPGQMFADRLFRYSPRQVTLAPGASQAIRLLLRKPKDLAEGEYRSHLMMRAVPDAGAPSIEAPSGGGAAVRLIPIFGIAIPVIVRHGDLAYDVTIDAARYLPADNQNPLPRVRFDLERSGERSSFGDLNVTLKDGGKETVLARLMRLAVYTPNPSRTVEMVLRVPEGTVISGKTLDITYKTIADEGAQLLASGAVQVP